MNKLIFGILFFWMAGAFALEPIAPGALASNIKAPNQDGALVELASFKGKPVLLYFYPKDDTPGCTKEACNLRDRFTEFKKLGAVVLGISRQDKVSHQEFRKKFHLPFDLLVDENGEIAKAFGVSTMPIVGFHKRQSILIGSDGKIVKFYKDVNPDTHADLALRDLKAYLGK